ncbi:MFS transporter [Pseudarthrobacter sp. lyk4-40-TYG-27]|uniref:MFS transporter n=1 Tax=Pseudarthrobacter sp. lyk4-40-TYG-27 TaxID=3040305 RepID=UPI0025541688|nr:MFS transporter [Pseudarthrobacter sp. lyk4-40-TYG-27]
MSSTHVTPAPGSLAEAVAQRRMNTRAWVITTLLILFQVIAFADKAVLGLVAQQAIPELGISTVEFGFIGSAFFFLYAIFSVLIGLWAGRAPIKWFLLAMGLSWAALQFPMLFGGGAAILLVTRILRGGAEGPATAMSLSSAHFWFRPADRTLPSNLIAVGSTLGPVIAAPALAAIIISFGWRWAFGALGVVGAVWVMAWFLLGADGPFGAKFATKDKQTPTRNRQAPESLAAEETAPENDRLAAFDSQHKVPLRAILLSGSFVIAVFAGFTNFWTQGFLTTWSPK